MRRRGVLAALGFAVLASGSAHASGFDLRLGGFVPKASSNLFRDDASLYTVRQRDWRGVTGGAEYSLQLADNIELGFSLDGYSRTIDTSYRDFVNDNNGGRDIRQTLRLSAVPLGVNLRFISPTRKSLSPYASVGADLYFYEYKEFGDFIDFGDPTLPIIADSFVANGVLPGAHAAAGLRVPINYDFALSFEGRYQWAKGNLGDDFRARPGEAPLKLDLSGWSATAGINIRF
jgi:Outer membrane protein beta-barrel domain